MPRKNLSRNGFTTYLRPEVIDMLDKIAAEDYTSRTKVIEHAVDEFIERRCKHASDEAEHERN